MAPADQGNDAAASAAPAPALRRQLSYSCSRGRAEPMHDRKLSYSYSFSSAVASPSSTSSSSTSYLPLSNKSSCESVPVPELDKQSSFSSASSYESFFQLEAAAETDHDCSSFLEFAPATQAPAVQTMMAQGQHAGGGVANGYDPKRLPSSMFRTRSTSPAEWSVTSNDSLFSIQFGHSGDVGALYSELYYDAAGGFHGLPSAGREAWKLPTVKEVSAGDASGGLCVRDDCARCSGKNRKSVGFATIESVHSVVFPTLADAPEEAEAPATEAKAPGSAAEGWCAFGCCWPSQPLMWWPRCACRGCDCRWL